MVLNTQKQITEIGEKLDHFSRFCVQVLIQIEILASIGWYLMRMEALDRLHHHVVIHFRDLLLSQSQNVLRLTTF